MMNHQHQHNDLEVMGDSHAPGSTAGATAGAATQSEEVAVSDGDDTNVKDNPISVSATTSIAFSEKLRFLSSTCGYRILRFTFELLLVEYTTSLGFSISVSGSIFLAYYTCAMCTSLSQIWFPTIFFNATISRALLYFLIAGGLLFAGIFGVFHPTQLPLIYIFACAGGIGSSLWNVNMDTIIAKTFPNDQISEITQIRLGYDCFGLILPSIPVAIFNSTHSGIPLTIIRQSVLSLSLISFLTFLVGSDLTIKFVSKIDSNNNASSCSTGRGSSSGAADSEEKTQGTAKRTMLLDTFKTFMNAKILKYLVLEGAVYAFVAVFVATTSVGAEQVFNVEGTYVWLASIGAPVGGVLSVVITMLFMWKGYHTSDNTRLRSTSFGFLVSCAIVISIIVCIDELSGIDYGVGKIGRAVSMSWLVFIGLVVGTLYGFLQSSSSALWYKAIQNFLTDFVSRANVIDNFFCHAMIGITLQLQTLLINAVQSSKPSAGAMSITIATPLVIFVVICIIISYQIQRHEQGEEDFEKDETETASASERHHKKKRGQHQLNDDEFPAQDDFGGGVIGEEK